MAGHLAAAGYSLRAWNRSDKRRGEWADAHSGKADVAGSIAEAASGADIVIVCVGNDEDLAQVVLEADGALAHMAEGTDIAHMDNSRSVALHYRFRAGEVFNGAAAHDCQLSILRARLSA